MADPSSQQQLLQATIALVSGAIGGGVGLLGVLLGARLTEKRENKKKKQDLYGRIFRHLADAQFAARTALWWYGLRLPGPHPEAEKTRQEGTDRGIRALVRLRHVAYLAGVVVGSEVGTALDELDEVWIAAPPTQEGAVLRDAAVRKAIDRVKQAATRDL